MLQTGCRHANMLTRQLKASISMQGTEMLEILQSKQLNDNAPKGGPTQPAPQEYNPPPNPAANTSTQQGVQLEMLRTLQAIQANMNTGGNGGGRGTRDGCGSRGGRCGQAGRGPRVYAKTPDEATFHCQDTTKYCWTHGGCNHVSVDCTRQAPGHNNAATRENCLLGSNAFCQHVV